MKKTALITGVLGQDGSYLAQFLLGKGYHVYGVAREKKDGRWRHDVLHITDRVTVYDKDLTDVHAIRQLLIDTKPGEIYNLAAQSSVVSSIDNPDETLNFNIVSVESLLKAVASVDPSIKVFHASSSEIFDPAAEQPLRVDSPIAPANPYGISKAVGHRLVIEYREKHGLFAVNGILFPHESPLRDAHAFIQKTITAAKDIKSGRQKEIVLGQIENERDFGDARRFVEAMWMSLQVDHADDYIISSGIAHSILSIATYILDKFGLSHSVIQVDPSLFRHPNAPLIVGDGVVTMEKLGWSHERSIFRTIDDMIEFN